jgi:Tol biopolymer transport system component
MTFPRFALAVTLVTLALGRMAAQSPEADLQRAVQKELASGDLDASITEYLAIAARAESTSRAVAARALLRAADSHAKRGDRQARDLYQRIVASFADQAEVVAQARARLAAVPGPGAASVVWTGAAVDTFGNGSVSPDGRHIAYVDWTTGDLALHDLTRGTDRRLTNIGDLTVSPGIYAGGSVFAPEGTRIAFAWFNRADGRQRGDENSSRSRYDVRLVSTAGTGIPQFKVIYDNEDTVWVHPYDWSRDGRFLALQIERTDRTGQIALLDVRDGGVQVLKSFPWQAAGEGMRFSPDGRYLAFDLRVANQGQRDVYLLAADGSRETPIVVQPSDEAVLGWSPDGSRLLFWSDRSGPRSLWTLDVKDGRPAGAPKLVTSAIADDPGRFAPLGLTADGALLYVSSRPTGSGIQVAHLDFEATRLASPPRDAGLELASTNAARTFAWSRNGQSLAVSRRVRPGMDAAMLLSVKDMATGAIRETLPQSGSCGDFLQWASSGAFFICHGSHVDERQSARPLRYGIVRMTADTGEVTFVAPGRAPALSSDGRTVYLLRDIEDQPGEQRVAIVERQLASGVERELLRRSSLAGLSLSPDGRWLATVARNPDAGTNALVIVSMSSDKAHEAIVLPPGETFNASTLFWSPDSASVLAAKSRTGIKPVFLRATLDGKLTTHPDLELGVNIRVHPDGRQIAYAVPGEGAGITEVYRLDGLVGR